MQVLLILVAASWGAGAGLLLPRAAHRLSVDSARPWSAECPVGHPITGAFGGWVGRARCAEACGPYGPATLAVSTVTALVCAVLAAVTDPRPEVAVWLLAAPVAVLLALVDYRVHRLPDVLTLPLAAATLVLLCVVAALPAAVGSWPTALLGGLALGATYLVLFLINPAGMGFGDVKLALSLGTALGWYGWPILLVGAFAGLLYGAMYGLGMVILRRAGRKSAIPLGPFMIGGAFTGVVLGAFAAA
ncbi:prepilin peptidase [Streptomyces sp. HD]|uniref:prepilin peptidase n=1 Tax=Streptomyces sp. HD TaxID=3020892 RepID=UPI00232E51BA|nr:A24 family peptidase [Streptomyces sp. HD]MDC0773054.1 A24 family peptidase [Streptomyces sp. HD]